MKSKELHWRSFKKAMNARRIYNTMEINKLEFDSAPLDLEVFESHGYFTIFKKAAMYAYIYKTLNQKDYEEWMNDERGILRNDQKSMDLISEIIRNDQKSMDLMSEIIRAMFIGTPQEITFSGVEVLTEETVPPEDEDDKLVKWSISQWRKTGELI